MVDEEGNVPRAKQALLADAIGTTFGAIFGTSAVTAYVESASGVAEGGRTGLTAVSTAMLFVIALFLSPLFLMIPSPATAPALILVGLFMLEPIKEINLTEFTEAIPAFVTLITMPLTYSIADGIAFGMITYVIIKLATGKIKELKITTVIISILFVIKIII
jgi:AGZA family xanthine/uracil permease-like MFS transporter